MEEEKQQITNREHMKRLRSHQCYCRRRKEVFSQSHGLLLIKTEVLYHWLQANN